MRGNEMAAGQGKHSGAAAQRPSFGTRVAIVDRLLGGDISRETACHTLAIPDEKLDEYLHEHARDKLVSLDDFRMPSTLDPVMRELWSHLKQLESLLRARHRELVLLRQIARGRGLI